MLLHYFQFLIFVIILYVYTNENDQFAATLSSIRNIWSGNCQLSCRHSEFSQSSSLSRLNDTPGHVTSPQIITGPTHGGRCESCPCGVIDDVIRKCEPVAQAYANLYDSITDLYDNVLKTVSDIHECGARKSECGVSCHRQIQANQNNTSKDEKNIEKKYSSTKLNLKGAMLEIPKTASDTVSKLSFVKKSSSVKIDPRPGSEKTDKDSGGCTKSKSFVKVRSDLNDFDSPSCQKCMNKGNVCMDRCPKANMKNKL